MPSTLHKPSSRSGGLGETVAQLRIPPNSLEAEEAVLGTLLDDAAAWYVVEGVLQPEDFYRFEHRRYFAALVALRAAGQVADPIMLHRELQRRGEDEEVGGFPPISHLLVHSVGAPNVLRYALIVAQDAARRFAIEQAQSVIDAAYSGRAEDLQRLPEHAGALAHAVRLAIDGPQARGPFDVVPFAAPDRAEPEPPAYAWAHLVPMGVVTLLSAHGGTGKTTVALMLSVATASARGLFGLAVREGAAVFYSAEECAARLEYLLATVTRSMGVNRQELEGRLHLLDATAYDPALFAEAATEGGRREARSTGTFEALREFLRRVGATLLVIDNASDTFDASEIDRAKVRAFMRTLTRLAQELGLAVLLLAHVPKSKSKSLDRDAEDYSGSTAWNNSARSRLAMRRESDGTLVLEQQKHNFGLLHEPLRLTWPKDGLPQLDEPFGAVVQGIADRGHERALIRLIAEYTARGERVGAPVNSPTRAAKMLRREPTFPHRLKDGEVDDLLRQAERAGYLQRVEVQTQNRKWRECWAVTAAGFSFADLPAPTAPSAPGSQPSAHGALGANGARQVRQVDAGGMGGSAAQTGSVQ